MKVRDAVLREVLQPFAVSRQRRAFFSRAFEAPPRSFNLHIGWSESAASWRKNVDEFDRLLLGVAGPRKFGLHFSSGNWHMSPEEDPSLRALQTGERGELHYYAIDLSAGNTGVLEAFPRWANDARNYLIVIDREHPLVRRIEAEAGISCSTGVPIKHVEIKALPAFPVYTRGEWLVKHPIPLFSALDLHQPEKVAIFGHLGLIYQSVWKQSLEGEQLYNLYLMLFALVNGLRLIDALETHCQAKIA